MIATLARLVAPLTRLIALLDVGVAAVVAWLVAALLARLIASGARLVAALCAWAVALVLRVALLQPGAESLGSESALVACAVGRAVAAVGTCGMDAWALRAWLMACSVVAC